MVKRIFWESSFNTGGLINWSLNIDLKAVREGALRISRDKCSRWREGKGKGDVKVVAYWRVSMAASAVTREWREWRVVRNESRKLVEGRPYKPWEALWKNKKGGKQLEGFEQRMDTIWVKFKSIIRLIYWGKKCRNTKVKTGNLITKGLLIKVWN